MAAIPPTMPPTMAPTGVECEVVGAEEVLVGLALLLGAVVTSVSVLTLARMESASLARLLENDRVDKDIQENSLTCKSHSQTK